MRESKKKNLPYYENLLRISTGFLAVISLTACSTMNSCPGYSPAEEAKNHVPQSNLSGFQKQKYEEIQKHIGTNKNFLYHDAVVEPKVFETPYSLYILGFEKPDDNSLTPYCTSNDISCNTPKFDHHNFKGSQKDDFNEISRTQDDIEKNLSETPLTLTHILNVAKKTSNTQMSNRDSCFIFNVYGHDSDTPWCQNHYKANILNNDVLKSDWKREGWRGLDQLAADIKEKVAEEKPTHIILMATGWNTPQYESYLDFKAWMDIIANYFNNKPETLFRPIFIGTTWQSGWPFWDKIGFSAISNITKGNDADEIGFTWENYLLNDLIKPIVKSSNPQLKLVVIGHSFGSRIALGAHYARNILIRNGSTTEVPLTIIGMQAAFPIARFVTTEGKEHQYVEANKDNAIVVITSSKHDKATDKMCIQTKYVGAGCGLEQLKKDESYKEFVSVLDTNDNGKPIKSPDRDRVSVYDASPFVNCELKGTASGAHSDVYDDAMGTFLGEIISWSANPDSASLRSAGELCCCRGCEASATTGRRISRDERENRRFFSSSRLIRRPVVLERSAQVRVHIPENRLFLVIPPTKFKIRARIVKYWIKTRSY